MHINIMFRHQYAQDRCGTGHGTWPANDLMQMVRHKRNSSCLLGGVFNKFRQRSCLFESRHAVSDAMTQRGDGIATFLRERGHTAFFTPQSITRVNRSLLQMCSLNQQGADSTTPTGYAPQTAPAAGLTG